MERSGITRGGNRSERFGNARGRSIGKIWARSGGYRPERSGIVPWRSIGKIWDRSGGDRSDSCFLIVVSFWWLRFGMMPWELSVWVLGGLPRGASAGLSMHAPNQGLRPGPGLQIWGMCAHNVQCLAICAAWVRRLVVPPPRPAKSQRNSRWLQTLRFNQ